MELFQTGHISERLWGEKKGSVGSFSYAVVDDVSKKKKQPNKKGEKGWVMLLVSGNNFVGGGVGWCDDDDHVEGVFVL